MHKIMSDRKSKDVEHPSSFPGMRFERFISKARTFRSDPMSNGMDLEILSSGTDKVEGLKKDGVLPSSYDIHSSINLLDNATIDTTEKDFVVNARLLGFDPDGFREGRPLEKGIFYMDPYVTCEWCNLMSFVDVMSVRRTIALPKEIGAKVPPETLPPCRRCGKANYFHIGPHDFSVQIAQRERLARAKRKRERKAAKIIQRSYRAYLRRMYGFAGYAARLARLRLENKAATIINALARGRLGRRIARTERHLVVIKDAHSILITHALRESISRSKCFWYDRKEDSEFVFRDYVGFCSRTGFMPPRFTVEANIAELSRRITARKNELTTLVQRIWRGLMARRIVKYFRLEVIRLKQFMWGRVFKVQRMFRGHVARLKKVPRFQAERRKEKMMKRYMRHMEDKLLNQQRAREQMQVIVKYRKERGEERTARFTRRIDPPSAYSFCKMKAFSASIYGGEEVKDAVDSLLELEQQQIAEEKAAIKAEQDRKAFIRGRIEEHGPWGFGLRGLKPAETGPVVAGIRLGPEAESSRSKGMRKLFEGEMQELTRNLIERSVHDHKRQNLQARLTDYNTRRFADLSGLAVGIKISTIKSNATLGSDSSDTDSRPSTADSRPISPEQLGGSSFPSTLSWGPSVTMTGVGGRPKSPLLSESNFGISGMGLLGKGVGREAMSLTGRSSTGGADILVLSQSSDGEPDLPPTMPAQMDSLDTALVGAATASASASASTSANMGASAGVLDAEKKEKKAPDRYALRAMRMGLGKNISPVAVEKSAAASTKRKGMAVRGLRQFRPLPYKFPVGINDDPMACLEEDVDYLFK